MKEPTVVKAIVVKAFEGPLGEAGFRKKSGSWYLDAPETILVANLQKSNWGPQYYVNLAVWFKALGTEEAPKEQFCHLRKRLESITDIREALNLR
jgi:hypothetical protein